MSRMESSLALVRHVHKELSAGIPSAGARGGGRVHALQAGADACAAFYSVAGALHALWSQMPWFRNMSVQGLACSAPNSDR